MGDRCTKKGHDPITGVLVDCALETVHGCGDQFKAPIQDVMDIFGVEFFG